MIILWTDALIYLLLISVVSIGVLLRNHDGLKRPLKKIAANKSAMVSMIILLLFVAVGLLDSIHFRAEGQRSSGVISVLDYCTQPLWHHTEKTYSAPFSAYLYSKEYITQEGGHQVWAFPRLQFGGSHLTDPELEKTADVLSLLMTGLSKGLVLCLAGVGLRGVFRGKKSEQIAYRYRPGFIFITISILTIGVAGLIELSMYYHIFGTDKVGEDVFYQTIKSIRTGLVIGSLTTFIMLPLAVVFGILAGFYRGWVDDIIQYIYTTLNAIPSVLLIAASILMVQVYMANHPESFTNLESRADLRLLFLCLILGVTSWTGLCRMLRAETLKLREMGYVQAAKVLGVKPFGILFQHILPNVMHIILIAIVLDFSALVLAEAVLSYINIGVDPSTYSWGNMINGARLEMAREPVVWWPLIAAFVFMFVLVLTANLFADAVRDAFDPRRSQYGQ
ncbi:MAG: ABC transporter permease [Methylococcales bacterium]|nr:ABC transporter permease [Methylococcales bacterium]MDG2364067.1 ABC transporter permease [Methylococcaceae bacterium]